ncbi:MAG: Trm112 family protein [Candidatus Dormibacterales bacterium]
MVPPEVPADLLAILACPACHGSLEPAPGGDGLDCAACKLRYPVVDGIPIMLVEEASPLPQG